MSSSTARERRRGDQGNIFHNNTLLLFLPDRFSGTSSPNPIHWEGNGCADGGGKEIRRRKLTERERERAGPRTWEDSTCTHLLYVSVKRRCVRNRCRQGRIATSTMEVRSAEDLQVEARPTTERRQSWMRMENLWRRGKVCYLKKIPRY